MSGTVRGKIFEKLEHGLQLVQAMRRTVPNNLTVDDVVFLCIGTDRSTGDSLAPMVGLMLEQAGYTNVVGTIHDPVHAMNLSQRWEEIPKDKVVIAIDACLSTFSKVGLITFYEGSLKPGSGVKKELGEYGDYSIKGMVNVGGFMEYFVLQNTRLSTIMKMATTISDSLQVVFPLHQFTNHKQNLDFYDLDFHDFISRARKKSKLSVGEFAKKIGKSSSYINKIENRKIKPRKTTQEYIADIIKDMIG